MPASLISATRHPVIDDSGLMATVNDGVFAAQADTLSLSDKHLALWIDFLEQAGVYSQKEIEEELLTTKQDAEIVFIKKSIGALQERMEAIWSKYLPEDYIVPSWDFRFQEKHEVNKPTEHGFITYRDTPYCWHIPVHLLPEKLKPVIISMVELANDMLLGVNSFSMSEFMDYFGGGIMEELEIIDKAGAIDGSLEEALKVDRTLGVIEEYLEFRCGEVGDDGWGDLQNWYMEIKNAKTLVLKDFDEVETRWVAYKADSNAKETLDLLEPAMKLLASNKPHRDSQGYRAPFERLEQEWFDDEMYLGDMAVSTISFLKFEFDSEFDQNIQAEWENGAIFGGFMSLETNTPQMLLKRLDELALGVTILTLIEIFVDTLIKGDKA